MNSKIALVLIAAVGSAALAASAQTQDPSDGAVRPASAPDKAGLPLLLRMSLSVTVSSPAPRQGTAGTRYERYGRGSRCGGVLGVHQLRR